MTLSWFQAFGIEAEYMIVDRQSLAVRPIADVILTEMAGKLTEEVSLGPVAWSNELVLHVIELKADGPKADLKLLAHQFHQAVTEMNQRLEAHQAMLLPTAMHPFFDPARETKLWPHGNREIYFAYNRIFDCRGHGWSNLQSLHINFPFGNDQEFTRLHDAIRLVLPLLPALAASSPLQEGQATGNLDQRLFHYRYNQKAVPSLTGLVVPERVASAADYQTQILERLYQDIAPHDPEGILSEEWINSRGAIARFDRGAIEIRLLDLQECPAQDFAMAALVISLVQALCQRPEPLPALPETQLAVHLWSLAQAGRSAWVQDSTWLQSLGLSGQPRSAGQIWRELAQNLQGKGLPWDAFAPQMEPLLAQGSLAERILKTLGPNPQPQAMDRIYRKLAQCLSHNQAYDPASDL